MVRPEPLRGQGAWWQRPLIWLSRFRLDPGTANLQKYAPIVERIVSQRATLRRLTDDDFMRRSAESVSIDLGDDDELASFLGEASEVARRRLGLEPFEVQLLAAVSMLRGRVVDMATGEGKTLVGFLVSAGLAAAGRRVHVLSANDYLAGRDADAGAPLFSGFGLTCAAVLDGMDDADRAEAYRTDVVYATVHQIGFDLLRDRQRLPGARRLVPGLDAAVVDEIDAVLLDDAMVPLVIAGDADPQPEEAPLVQVIAKLSEEEHYRVEGDLRSVSFTEAGIDRIESTLGIEDLYAEEHLDLLTAAHVALHAHALVERDVHYLVVDGRVQLVNDARGRVADRQRWPDGLHAAIERKEGLEVTGQAEVLDQVLVETAARGYRTLTGMSGTALEAAERLSEDLDIKTGAIPTHRPCIREDALDRMFVTVEQRDTAAAEVVRAAHVAGQPVLVGTGSVVDSERFARLLVGLGVEARVLNAKNDAAEAEIISRAGEHGAVTVSTQMAGRGVDIQLGPGAAETGGLLVVGLGRYDSVRLDRQLRGRSGRQGDPGRSVFYTSLEDDVVTEQLRISDQPRSVTPDGLIGDQKFARLYEHSQRVAEGKLLQLHRTTRSYHTMTDQHRQAVLDMRERILTEPDALDDYLQQVFTDAPDVERAWATRRRPLAIEVVLYRLDRAWSDHLNLLTAVREGIHLRVLGRQNPLDEFNRIAGDNFRSLGAQTLVDVRQVLEDAPDDATSLGDLGLRRPSSTWTYMVTDNPFGSEADRVVAFLGNFIRGGRPPGLTYT